MAKEKHQDDEIKAKLDRLARIDEANRVRVRRYHEKVKKAGGRQLSAIISGEAYETLCRIRDAGLLAGESISFGKIIERALTCYVDNQGSDDDTSININGDIDRKIHEKQNELFPDMPDPLNVQEYRKWLFEQIDGLQKSGLAWAAITKKLNTEGIKSITDKEFGRGAVFSFYKREKEKMGAK